MKHVLIFNYRNTSAGDISLVYDNVVALPSVGDTVSAGATRQAKVINVGIHYESNQVNVVIDLEGDDS